MNQNFGKTALMAGACAILGLAYSPSVYADAAVNTVQSVQQSKKVTSTVSDAMGPVIGASILEKVQVTVRLPTLTVTSLSM